MAALSTKTFSGEAVPPTFGCSPAAESTTQTVSTVTLLQFSWRWVWPPFSWTLIGIGCKSFPQTTTLSRILNDFPPTAVHFLNLHQNLCSPNKASCLPAIKQENDASGKNLTLIFSAQPPENVDVRERQSVKQTRQEKGSSCRFTDSHVGPWLIKGKYQTCGYAMYNWPLHGHKALLRPLWCILVVIQVGLSPQKQKSHILLVSGPICLGTLMLCICRSNSPRRCYKNATACRQRSRRPSGRCKHTHS